ncbi:MAG: hypothetical protein AAFY88_01110 [Acidobacteriota bacterium]
MDLGTLAARLIKSADEARYSHPRRALDRAAAARAFVASVEADELPPDGRGLWLDLQSDAWAVYGSAARSVGDLESAESALLVSLAFLDASSGAHPPQATAEGLGRRARLAQRAGYVRMDQGRFREALDLLAQARGLYREVKDPVREACVQVDEALVFKRAGRPRDAVSRLVSALGGLDRGAEPRSYLAAVHNLARLLLEVAESAPEEEEALRWLELARREHGRYPERLHVLRLRALAALTAARFGRVEEAIAELEALAAAFGDIGAAGDQVLALLYVADLSLQRPGATPRQVSAMTGLIFPLLRRLPVDDEAKAALRRLLTQAERQGTEPAALRRAVELMERNLGA